MLKIRCNEDLAKREIAWSSALAEESYFLSACNHLVKRIRNETVLDCFMIHNGDMSLATGTKILTNYKKIKFEYHFSDSKKSQNEVLWLLGTLLAVKNIPDFKRVKTHFDLRQDALRRKGEETLKVLAEGFVFKKPTV